MEYERDVKYYKVEMILIYQLYPIIIGGTKVFGENLREMVRKNVRVQKGRQVITLNLAITLRVTLVGIFKILSHPLYIYKVFEMLFLYKIGYRVPFQCGYFHIKDFDTLYMYYSAWWLLLSWNGVEDIYRYNVQIVV